MKGESFKRDYGMSCVFARNYHRICYHHFDPGTFSGNINQNHETYN